MPRSRVDWTGVMEQPSISSGDVGNWCCRRADAHHRNFVSTGLGWVEACLIASRTWLLPRNQRCSLWALLPRSADRIHTQCVSSAYMCGDNPWLSITLKRSTVYKTKRIGPRMGSLWHAANQVSDWWLIGTSTHVLSPGGQVRLEPTEGCVANTEGLLQALEQNRVIDGIKGCRQVQKNQSS